LARAYAEKVFRISENRFHCENPTDIEIPGISGSCRWKILGILIASLLVERVPSARDFSSILGTREMQVCS